MAMATTKEQINLSYPVPLDCDVCERTHRRLVITNTAVIENGKWLGIESVVRFASCGARVPDLTAEPAAVAWWLEMHEDD